MKKNILIVGASSGIGLATAEMLIEQDNIVYNFSRTSSPLAKIINTQLDVRDTAALDEAFKSLPLLDAIIYCAANSLAAPIEHIQTEDYRYLFEVNLFGMIECVKRAIPLMRERNQGRIILVSSVAGVLPVPFDSFYSASKAAVNMFAKAANIELEPYNIKVTSIMPGGVKTRFSFKRKVYNNESCGDYGRCVNEATDSLTKMEQNGMNANEVAQSICKLLKSKNPPETMACGFVNKSYCMAEKLLPDKLMQEINKNKYFS